MILHPGLPYQGACRRIQSVGIGAHIAEVHRKLVGAGEWTKTHGGPDRRLRRVGPDRASALRVEGAQFAIRAADEQHAADDGRLGVGRGSPRKSKCPFQLQSRHLVRRQPCHLRRLKAAVAEIRAPAVPLQPVERPAKSEGAVGTLCRGFVANSRRRTARNSARDEGGDCLALVIRPLLGHVRHAARCDYSENMVIGHQLQRAAAGYTALLVAGVVARRAMLGVKSGTAVLRERRPAGRNKQEGGCSAQFHGSSWYCRRSGSVVCRRGTEEC